MTFSFSKSLSLWYCGSYNDLLYYNPGDTEHQQVHRVDGGGTVLLLALVTRVIHQTKPSGIISIQQIIAFHNSIFFYKRCRLPVLILQFSIEDLWYNPKWGQNMNLYNQRSLALAPFHFEFERNGEGKGGNVLKKWENLPNVIYFKFSNQISPPPSWPIPLVLLHTHPPWSSTEYANRQKYFLHTDCSRGLVQFL